MKRIKLIQNKIEVMVGDRKDLKEAFSIWRALEKTGRLRTPYFSIGCMEPLIINFLERENLIFIIILKKDNPVFLLPLLYKNTLMRGIPCRILQSCINYEIPESDCLVQNDQDFEEIWHYFMNFLIYHFRWDCLIIKQVFMDDGLYNALYKVLSERKIKFYKKALFPTPTILTYSEPWDKYISSLSSNARMDLKRKLRKFKAQDNATIEVFTDYDERLHQAIEDIFSVADRSWQGKMNTAISSTPQLKNFYQGLITNFAKSRALRLYILKINNLPIAFMLNLLLKKISVFFKTAYDPLYKNLSPGIILLSHAIQDCFNMGFEEFRLSGVLERYKMRWSNSFRQVGSVLIFNSTLKGKLCYLQENLFIPLIKRIYYR